MSPPPTPPMGAGGSASGRAARRLLQPAVRKAAEALNDPETRQRLADQGRDAVAAGQRWNEKRRQERDAEGDPGLLARAGETANQALSQRKLERRVERLRAAVDALVENRPSRQADLDPTSVAIDDAAAKLTVAAALPAETRPQAHRQIDLQLRDLEADLFDRTFEDGEPRRALPPSTDDEPGG